VIRLSKLADYGMVIMTRLAHGNHPCENTQTIAEATNSPRPMASKILKLLTRADLLSSQRGANGGYELARAAELISVAEIIEALDGPIAITDCSGGVHDCGIESLCPTRTNWQWINVAIRDALDGISLSDMAAPKIPAAYLAAQSGAGHYGLSGSMAALARHTKASE
jgi:FeS assembly SUF system regulator